MKTLTTPFFVGCALVIAAGSWVAGEARTRTREAEAAASSERLASRRLAGTIRRAESHITDSESEKTEVRRRLEAARANAKSAAPRVASPTVVGANQEMMQADPKLQVLALQAGHAALTTRYGALYSRLSLTAAQIETLEAAMLRRQEQTMDLQALQKNASPETKETLAQLRKEAQTAYDDAVKGVLGPEGVQLLKDYERSSQLRSKLLTLAGDCAASGEPMTAAQFHQMEAIFTGASASYKKGRLPELTEQELNAAQAGLGAVLTPRQQTIVDRYWARETAARRASMSVLMVAQSEGQP